MKVPFVGFTEMPDRQVVDLLGRCVNSWVTTSPSALIRGRWTHWQKLWVLNRLDEHRIFFAEALLRHDDMGLSPTRSSFAVADRRRRVCDGRYEAREWLETAKVRCCTAA